MKPHQVLPVEHLLKLLRTGANVIDGSKCGAGKTYVTSAVLKELDRPTLVVVPKVAEHEWLKAADHFGVKFSLCSYDLARAGYSRYGHWDNPLPRGEKNDNGDSVRTFYVCQSCQRKLDLDNLAAEPCYCHPQGVHCVVPKQKRWNYGKFHWHPGIKCIAFDEAHRCSAPRSLNAEMMVAAKRQGIQTIMLTATPACTPLNMRAIGYALDLHDDNNFYQWARRHGCGTLPGLRGFHWTVGRERQVEMMDKIKSKIFPMKGIALDYKDIPGFPERVVEPYLYDFKDSERMQKIYDEMSAQVEKIDKRGLDYVPNALTDRLIMKQRIEMLKVPVMAEMAEDYITKGMSVALFVNYTETLEELCQRLKTRCVIRGVSTEAEKRQRQNNIDGFQDDKEPLIIVNNKAGRESISLHDIHGYRARMGLVSIPESAIELIQLLGRLHRTGGMSPAFYKLILAKGTIETRIESRVRANQNNIEALTDADIDPLRA